MTVITLILQQLEEEVEEEEEEETEWKTTDTIKIKKWIIKERRRKRCQQNNDNVKAKVVQL